MREPHLDFLAFAARDLEGIGIGERANLIAYVLVDIPRDLAGRGYSALGLECANGTIVLARPAGENAPLVDDPGMRELGAGGTDVDVPVAIEDEVLLREATPGLYARSWSR